jgi:hypothetical protein
MSYCPIRASRGLLIGLEYILSEVVVRCLSIAQCAPVLEREPWFVPQVRPYDLIVLRWSATWWRGAAYYHCKPVDHWVLVGGIDRFLIAASDHVDSLGFVVRISLRANPNDWVVVDGVLIYGRAGPSIGFVVAVCPTAAWNVVAELLRPRGNSKSIVVVRRSSCFWVGCSRLSSSLVVNNSVSNRNYVPVENFLS